MVFVIRGLTEKGENIINNCIIPFGFNNLNEEQKEQLKTTQNYKKVGEINIYKIKDPENKGKLTVLYQLSEKVEAEFRRNSIRQILFMAKFQKDIFGQGFINKDFTISWKDGRKYKYELVE